MSETKIKKTASQTINELDTANCIFVAIDKKFQTMNINWRVPRSELAHYIVEGSKGEELFKQLLQKLQPEMARVIKGRIDTLTRDRNYAQRSTTVSKGKTFEEFTKKATEAENAIKTLEAFVPYGNFTRSTYAAFKSWAVTIIIEHYDQTYSREYDYLESVILDKTYFKRALTDLG